MPVVTLVLKLGGRALEAPGAPGALAAELAGIAARRVVVHGGGSEVSAWCARLGIAARFQDGLRVTDPETLEVAAAVLAGLANKRLVATFRAAGVDAVGLSALDGGIVDLDPHPDRARLGAVGTVRQVRPALLEALLGEGRVPVLASIGASRGSLLNVNADDLAAAVAGALRAQVLLLLSDVPGLRLDGALVPRLAVGELPSLLAHPEVRDGMVPKLAAAAAALAAGAERIQLAAWGGPGTLAELLAGRGGTTIRAEAEARGATDG